MPKIKINGREVEVAPGKTVIQACIDHGVFVPHYCWHPGLSPHGNCRMCLVKATAPPPAPPARGLAVACTTIVSEGLDVVTESPEVAKARQDVLEFLLINHPLD
jgi:NADH-quinone oxidoreductase subunit G